MSKEEINQGLEELNEKVGWNKLLSLTNPENLAEERKKVLEKPSYNPYFVYPAFSPDKDIEQEVSILNDKIGISMEDLEKDVNLGLLKQFQLSNRYLRVRDTSDFQDASATIFSRPDQHDVEWAQKNYKTKPPEENKTIAPEMVRKFMLLYMSGIPQIEREYEILTDPNRANIMIKEEEGKILLPVRDVSWEKLAGDLVHEIGTHAVQYEIGCRQPLPAFWLGFPFRAFASEGMAQYNEDLVVPDYTPRTKTRAGNTVAMVMAEEHPFSEINRELLDAGFIPEEAFKYTLMAKRGFSDTKKKGANFNRNLYIRGLSMVREYLENGGEEWILYTGRVSLEYTDRIKELKGLYGVPENLPKRLRAMANSIPG